MQDAIANRLNRESPRKTSTVVDKEKTSKEETKIEKETPQVNIKNLMKQYGFTLECNGSTLSGLCRNCKEEQG